MNFAKERVYFSTITINNWVPVFQDYPETNAIILESFKYCVSDFGIRVYAFVIMRDHIHFIWHCQGEVDKSEMINKFKQHTGRSISQLLRSINASYLENFATERKDRDSKIWKLKTSNLEIKHFDILIQKINYIHLNPTVGKYKSVGHPEGYLWSSAQAYLQ